MMTRWIVGLLLLAGWTHAGVQEMPPSFYLDTKSAVQHVFAPKFDISGVAAANKAAELVGEAPKFAAALKVNHQNETSGTWLSLNARQDLWRLKVSSKKAYSLNFAFEDFYLPESAKLFIYSPDYNQVRGPFTAKDNNWQRQLWTPVVFGETVVVEAVVDKSERHLMRLALTKVNHDYRGFGQNVDKSGSCNVDVACNDSQGWESQIKSVAVISTGGTRFCTGFLVNNTAQDRRPLFMTAYHCSIRPTNAASLVAYWNYENSDCRNSSRSGMSGDGPLSEFTTGATYLAGNSMSDFTIVEFNQPINPETEVFYAGWNASTENPVGVTAIHHPNTEEKRISFDYDATTTTGYNTTDFGQGTHIRVADWDVGTTEPGSSGSPLFNSRGQVVGQLHGGGAACGNDLPDWYGRISKSWGLGLKEVLDPVGSGLTEMDGIGFQPDYLIASAGLTIEGMGANGVADPGETLTAKVRLRNLGKNPVTDIDFSLSSSDASIEISDATRENLSLMVGEEMDLTFSIEVPESLPCGDKFSLNFNYGYGEMTHQGASEIQTGTATFTSIASTPGLAIPDNDMNGVSDALMISGSGRVVSVPGFEVSVDIEHTYIGDLIVRLIAPTGQSVTLHDRSGGNTRNLIGTFPTTLSSASDMAALSGVALDGSWTLSVSDTAGADTGTVRSWSIRSLKGYVCSQ